MSLSTLANQQSVDLRTKYLLFGYIRDIGIENQIIPSTIINLCITFYNSKIRIMCFQEKYSNPPIINMAELDTNAHFKCNITKT